MHNPHLLQISVKGKVRGVGLNSHFNNGLQTQLEDNCPQLKLCECNVFPFHTVCFFNAAEKHSTTLWQ